MTQYDLGKILLKPGYGIEPAFKPAYGKGAFSSKDRGAGQEPHLESTLGDAQIRSEAVSLNYSGKVRVRLKFFRRRLADYSRAISEKALVDCLQYGGLIRDDSENEICLIDEGQVKVETNEEERTEIVLEYPEVDFDNLFIARTKFGNAT